MLPDPTHLRRATAAAVAALALAALPGIAAAHVELVSSSPPAGASLEAPPTRVTIRFDGELDPARSGFTVTDPQGDEVGSGTVDLQVADRNILDGEVAIVAPGVYTVEWSVLGIDGHEIAGSFTFAFATPGTGTPDTAASTSRPAPGPSTIAGLLLLALAGLRLVRIAAVR